MGQSKSKSKSKASESTFSASSASSASSSSSSSQSPSTASHSQAAASILTIASEATTAKVQSAAQELGVSVVTAQTMTEAVAKLEAVGSNIRVVVAALGVDAQTHLFDRGGDRSTLITEAHKLGVPVIVFSHTACANADFARACFDAGAVDVVCKRGDLLQALIKLAENLAIDDAMDAKDGGDAAAACGDDDDDDAKSVHSLPPELSRSSSSQSLRSEESVEEIPWTLEEYPTMARRLALAQYLASPEGQAAVPESRKLLARLMKNNQYLGQLAGDVLHLLLQPRSVYVLPDAVLGGPASPMAVASSSASAAVSLPLPTPPSIVRFVVISDTHTMHKQLVLPEGEVLLHCGDLVGNYGDDCDIVGDVMKLAKWLNKQPFRRVFVIPGNHDIELDIDKDPEYTKAYQQFVAALAPHVTLLMQSGAEYRGLKIWGSPVLVDRQETVGKRYYSNGFETPERKRRGLWALLPEGLDVLMTHTPPWGDSGDPLLAERLQQLQRPPLVHCMGHAHREVGVGLHTIGVESVPAPVPVIPMVKSSKKQQQTELRRRIYINAAQERLLGDERGCGGAAWVFDLIAKD